jgi:hypothetical protein
MLKRAIVALALLAGAISANAQSAPVAKTDGPTIACPKESDFERYATLLLDDVSAAVSFELDHGCLTLASGTIVRIDHGSMQRGSNHICIRPVGSYDCVWTFAAHVRAK